MNIKPELMDRLLLLFIFLGVLSSCNDQDGETILNDGIENTDEGASILPNIMLIIADDMGLDATPGYDIGDVKPTMPNLERMISSGIRFTNLWSYATCTPTRSSILTGKYGFRTGVLEVGDELSTTENSLHNFLDNNTAAAYDHAVIGKWHLSNAIAHPSAMGVDYYAGLLSGSVRSYWDWDLVEGNSSSTSTEYTSSKFANLAIDWINDRSKPWFLWLAFNAPHTPFHLPGPNLHSQGALPTDQASIDEDPRPYYMAMIEAMDTELGRVINSMGEEEKENTIFIFIGDNGSPGQVVQGYHSRRAKGSIYQGGINVPMIISGKGVTRSNDIEDALINTTDLFATIGEIAGITVTDINDSRSFKALLTRAGANHRDYVFAENPNREGGMDHSIRNTSHKYIIFGDGTEALYNMTNRFIENPNLMSGNQAPLSEEDEAIKNELVAKLNEIL